MVQIYFPEFDNKMILVSFKELIFQLKPNLGVNLIITINLNKKIPPMIFWWD
jgi:hypothetical protein